MLGWVQSDDLMSSYMKAETQNAIWQKQSLKGCRCKLWNDWATESCWTLHRGFTLSMSLPTIDFLTSSLQAANKFLLFQAIKFVVLCYGSPQETNTDSNADLLLQG